MDGWGNPVNRTTIPREVPLRGSVPILKILDKVACVSLKRTLYPELMEGDWGSGSDLGKGSTRSEEQGRRHERGPKGGN